MRFAKDRFHRRRRMGHRRADAAFLPRRRDGTSVRPADGVSAFLLRLSVGGDGVADRLSRDRVEPGAIPAADDPEHFEKLGCVVTLAVLYGQARISAADATAPWPDLLLGVLFIAAFAKPPAWDSR